MSDYRRFEEFFARAAGNRPYRYQRRLAEEVPDVLNIPTGCGKTLGLIVSWLYGRMVHDEGPRRLVYALPMRTLVEQTRDVALSAREALGLSEAELPVHVLMGGQVADDWRERPEASQILIGTIDMLLSRALNRGYAENRFMWPVSFGLLGSDCRWVFDEVQLMGPARQTSAQLDGLRQTLGAALPCESVWVSATVDTEALQTVDRPAIGRVHGLPEADRHGPLESRLDARKALVEAKVSPGKPREEAEQVAERLSTQHVAATRSIVVLNTVEKAQELAKALGKRAWPDPGPEIVLLHSRYRPPEREARTRTALAKPPPGGTIIVATQVIEAGVDISARLLVTETAPFSSVTQRLGRCNRYGELEEGIVLWLDSGPYEGREGERRGVPYVPDDLNACRDALSGLLGESCSPLTLAALEVPEHREEWAVLRRRDLVDLFDTSPDLSGMDVDVSRFIRETDDQGVPVFFRRVKADAEAGTQPADQPAPSREEIVDVPIGDVRKALLGPRRRRAWTFDHVDGDWVPVQSWDMVPGQPLILDAAEGGYDELGWNPCSQKDVEPIEPPLDTRAAEGDRGARLEATPSDPDSAGPAFVPLEDHLAATRQKAGELLATVGKLDVPADAERAVDAAAALHDIGKAHRVFQDVMHSVAEQEGRSAEFDEIVLAKTPRRGPRYARANFRHELASALAIRDERARRLVPDGVSSSLVDYLVAAHHGRVRVSIRPAPDEQAPPDAGEGGRFALGVADGDELPEVVTPLGGLPRSMLDLSCMELGGDESWTAMVASLRDDPSLGPFRLAYLEAIVRVADWRASG